MNTLATDFCRALATLVWTAALALILLAPNAAYAQLAPVAAKIARFKIDPDQSTVSAAVAEPAAFVRGHATGMFRVVDGAVTANPNDIQATAHVRIILDASSYRSDSASRDRKVVAKTLEADKYPTIGFESNAVVGVVMMRANECTAIVTGFLTLHGESHPMNISVHAKLGPDGMLITDGEFKFNYEEFGVKVPGVLFGAILAGDEATVHFHFVATPDAGASLPAVVPRPAL